MKNQYQWVVRALIIIVLSFPQLIMGQSRAKWGEVSKEELAMKSYPADTNANAVILSEFGESTFDNDLNLKFHYTERVKILTKDGFNRGTIEISYKSKNRYEEVYNIEGFTYFLDDKGEVQKKELSRSDIFEEKLSDNYSVRKFTMPALTIGCIIEYQYTISTKSFGAIKDWTFQASEPVVWSEYIIRAPRNISYSSVRTGYHPFAIVEQSEVVQDFGGTAASVLRTGKVTCTQYQWAVANAPAIRKEPFMGPRSNYLNRVDVQLHSYTFDGQTERVLESWDKVVNELREHRSFSEMMKPTSDIKKLTAEVIKDKTTQEEKINAIYNWITKSIVYNGSDYYLCSTEDLDEIVEMKKGNSADLNCLMLSMLQAAGIPCLPFVTSTRDNGSVQDVYPIVSQFNYVLAMVKGENGNLFIDATAPNLPYTMLKSNLLGIKGFYISPDGFDWSAIPVTKKSILKSKATVIIAEDGSMSGKLQDDYQDYAAANIRSQFISKKDEAVLKESFDVDKYDYTLDSLDISGKNSVTDNLKLSANFSSTTYIQVAGDMMYLNPGIAHRITETPFKSEHRSFPIEYTFLSSRYLDYTFEMPEGFELKEKPNQAAYYSEDGALLYTRKITVEGRSIRVEKKFEIKKTDIPPRYYESVRNFYTRVIKAEADVLVLAKKAVPAPVVAPAPEPVKPEPVVPSTKNKAPKKK